MFFFLVSFLLFSYFFFLVNFNIFFSFFARPLRSWPLALSVTFFFDKAKLCYSLRFQFHGGNSRIDSRFHFWCTLVHCSR